MDSLRGWIINICTTVFFITAVEMILPSNNLKKYAKFVLGLILMTVIINPLVKLLNNGEGISTFINKTTSNLEQGYNNSSMDIKKESINETLEVFKENIEGECEKRLKAKYAKEKFKVDAKISYDEENGEYLIDSITVAVDSNMIRTVDKIEIKTDTSVLEDTLDQSQHGKELKKVVSSEFGLDENKIKIITLNKK